MMLNILALATLVRLSLPADVPEADARLSLARLTHADPPGVRIWTSHGEVYQRGERVRVYFRTERDAYVTILRVDTDGRVRVLFPREPWEDNYVGGGRTYDVPNYGRHDAFIVDDDAGVGYVFAVASADPFLYEPFIRSDHWDLQLISDGRIHGDPYTSLEELIQHIIPAGYTDYDTHLLPYHVERRYDYPRFLCYDCHAYVPWMYWNPYSIWCPRFSLFIYTDPYYYYPTYWYPGRVYGGARVVFVRPGGRDGRYVFKPREDRSVPGVTYRDRRRGDEARTPAERGVRGVDIGGVGSVPAPGRRTVESPGADRRAVGGSPAERIPVVGGRRKVEPGAAQQGPAQAREPQRPAERPRGIYIEPAARPQSRPEPRAEPQPDRRAEPRAEPRPERPPEPRAVSRPEPREDPRPSPELVRRRPD